MAFEDPLQPDVNCDLEVKLTFRVEGLRVNSYSVVTK